MDEDQLNQKEPDKLKFKCPNCGELSQDDVFFLCNVCEQDDLILKNGVYICPSCLQPGENFECIKCGSKKVHLESSLPS